MWLYTIFKSKEDANIKPSRFSIISWILGIWNGFKRVLWFSFLKLDKNPTITFFWLNKSVGSLLQPIHILGNPSCHSHYTFPQKMSLCARGTQYGFEW